MGGSSSRRDATPGIERYHGADGDAAEEARQSIRLVKAIRALLVWRYVGTRGRREIVDLDELAMRERAVMLER